MNEQSNTNRYRFNEVEERYRRMNGVFIITSSCLWIMYALYLLFKSAVNSIAALTAYGNMLFVVVFAVANAVIYHKNKKSIRLKQAVVIEMGLEYLLLGMQTGAEFIYFATLMRASRRICR